ncbi:MAG: Strongly similar to O-sialoglycoprotein endopeptidase, partial [uncultured bacterium]
YIEQYAKKGDPKKYQFPRPMIGSKDFDFSFSGLKTSVMREVESIGRPASPAGRLSEEIISNICASSQEAIIDVLVRKTLKAAKKYNAKSILLGGGVAANQALRNEFQSSIINLGSSIRFFAPVKNLCTDNAAMIATAAFFNHKQTSWNRVNANPGLYFDNK